MGFGSEMVGLLGWIFLGVNLAPFEGIYRNEDWALLSSNSWLYVIFVFYFDGG